MPNGVASSVPSSFVPTIDHSDDRDREHERDQEAVAHVAHHRVHRHAGVAAMAVAMRVLGAVHRRVVVRHAPCAASCSAIGSQTWPGTDWPAQW